MRLFTALEFPVELRKQLIALQSCLHPSVTRTTLEKLHLTLHFIGEVSADTAASLPSALEEIRVPSFEVTLSGAGIFRAAGGRRVAWVGVEVTAPLLQLRTEIGAILRRFEISTDPRPYRPHITLGRSNRSHCENLFRTQPDICATTRVTEFALFESNLSDSGAVYTVLQPYRLR